LEKMFLNFDDVKEVLALVEDLKKRGVRGA
jgi:hypothetical protein